MDIVVINITQKKIYSSTGIMDAILERVQEIEAQLQTVIDLTEYEIITENGEEPILVIVNQ